MPIKILVVSSSEFLRTIDSKLPNTGKKCYFHICVTQNGESMKEKYEYESILLIQKHLSSFYFPN